jgi:hypothetical protein
MKTKKFDILGDKDLLEITDIIIDHENHWFAFKDNQIDVEEGAWINRVTFNQYDEDPRIKQVILQEKSQNPPANKFWEGGMVANNKNIIVQAGRAD